MDSIKMIMVVILVIAMVASIIFGIVDIFKLVVDLGRNGTEIVERMDEKHTNMVQNLSPVNAVVTQTANKTIEDRNSSMLDIWVEHLRNITFSGLSLAVTFIGWKQVTEYFDEDKDIKIYGE